MALEISYFLSNLFLRIFYGEETESEGTFGGVSCVDAGCEAP